MELIVNVTMGMPVGVELIGVRYPFLCGEDGTAGVDAAFYI